MEEGIEQLLKELFTSCDVARKGKVAINDLRPLLHALAGDRTPQEEDIEKSAGGLPSDDVLGSLFEVTPGGELGIDCESFTRGMSRVIDRRVGVIFESADLDDDGVLNESELATALSSIGSESPESDARDAFARFDVPGVGGIDQKSFSRLFLSRVIRGKQQQQQQQQTTAAVATPVKTTGVAVTRGAAAGVGYVLEATSPAMMITGASPAAKSAAVADVKELRAAGLSDVEIDEMRALFESCDGDRDGTLGVQDITEAIERGPGAGATASGEGVEVKNIVGFLDTNWSSAVEFAEFAKGLHDLRKVHGVDLVPLLTAGSTLDGATARATLKALRKAIGLTPGVSQFQSGLMLLSPRTTTAATSATAEEAGKGAREREEKLRDEIDRLTISKKAAEDQLESTMTQVAALGAERDALKKQVLEANMEQKATAETARQTERQLKEFGEEVSQMKEKLRDAARLNQELRAQNRELADREAMARMASESAAKAQATASEALRERVDRLARERFEKAIGDLKAKNEELEKQAATVRAKAEETVSALREESRKLKDELALSKSQLHESEDRVRGLMQTRVPPVLSSPILPSGGGTGGAAAEDLRRRTTTIPAATPTKVTGGTAVMNLDEHFRRTALGEEMEMVAPNELPGGRGPLEARITQLDAEIRELRSRNTVLEQQLRGIGAGVPSMSTPARSPIRPSVGGDVILTLTAEVPAASRTTVEVVEMLLSGATLGEEELKCEKGEVPRVVTMARDMMTERAQLLRANEALSLELRAMTGGDGSPGVSSSVSMDRSGIAADDREMRQELERARKELASLRAHAAALVVRKVEAETRLAELQRKAETRAAIGGGGGTSTAGLLRSPDATVAEVRQLRAENASLARQLEHLEHRGEDLEVAPLMTSVRAEMDRRSMAQKRTRIVIGVAASVSGFVIGALLVLLIMGVGVCKK